MTLQTTTVAPTNGTGWRLHLKRTIDPDKTDTSLRPLLILPGYAMNSFIFGFHPRGTSMERCFAEQGFEVWSGDMRHQGSSKPLRRGAQKASLRGYADRDLPALLSAIETHTRSESDGIDIIGCSLGGSIVFAHLALCRPSPLRSVVAVGAPLRWDRVHPALGLAFRSKRVVSLIRFRGTRRLARAAFPILARIPGLLTIYANTSQIDMSRAGEITNTVEDPQPRINRDISHWIRAKDMVLGGINVTRALGSIENPLLLVLANRDGIVPTESATSALRAWGGQDASILEVGDPARWYAHADLFIGNEAPNEVFAPVARWLKERA